MENEALVIFPYDLIGAATVATLLGVNKSTITRRAALGNLPYLAQLDGPHGAYVFNRPDVLAAVAQH